MSEQGEDSVEQNATEAESIGGSDPESTLHDRKKRSAIDQHRTDSAESPNNNVAASVHTGEGSDGQTLATRDHSDASGVHGANQFDEAGRFDTDANVASSDATMEVFERAPVADLPETSGSDPAGQTFDPAAESETTGDPVGNTDQTINAGKLQTAAQTNTIATEPQSPDPTDATRLPNGNEQEAGASDDLLPRGDAVALAEAPDVVAQDVSENHDAVVVAVIDDDTPGRIFEVTDQRFEVIGDQIVLRDGFTLDHETEAAISFQLISRDPDGRSFENEVEFRVEDINEAPIDVSLDASTVAENAAGAVIGSVSSSDPDVGDVHSYSVSDDRFEVVDGQLKLRDGLALDHETAETLTLEITATDEGGLSTVQAFEIAVADVNESPIDVSLDASTVAENAAGAVIGAVSSSDPDAGDVHSYAVSDDRFEVIDGQLKLRNGVALDHETAETLTLEITVTDQGGLSTVQAFEIAVSDINEAPIDVSLDASTVAENAAGAVIGSVSSSDPDAGDVHSYSVSDDRFEVVDGQLKLRDGLALDHETAETLTLEITVTDQGGLSTVQAFEIAVSDINEAPIDVSLDTSTVAENAAGAVIGSVSSSDPDAGDVHSYAVSDDRFEVVDGQLKLRDGVALDHETAETLTLEITATDEGGLSTVQAFEIAVADVNESPIDVSLDVSTVAENAAGAVIGAVSSSDPDAGDVHSYAVSDDRFEVVDGQLKLRDGVALDHETAETLTLEITATDQGGLSTVQAFEIAVSDINEAPIDVSLDTSTVAENAAGAVIGSISSSDPDAGDVHSYAVSDDRFEVVDGQLKLRDGVELDHETAETLTLEITATDQGGLSTTQAFEIAVADVNEAPVELTLDTSSDNLIQNGSFENFDVRNGKWKQFNQDDSGAWDVNGRIEVWDNLKGAASEGQQHIELDAQRGMDSIGQTVETEVGKVYDLSMDVRERIADGTDTVEIYWNGELVERFDPETSEWETFDTKVVGTGRDHLEIREASDENDSYGALLDNVSLTAVENTIAENVEGAVVGSVTASDPDEGDVLNYSVSDERFEVVDGQLKLRDGVSLDHESEASVSLEVTATDTGGLSTTESFEIAIADVNEAPLDVSLTPEQHEMPRDVPQTGDTVTLDVRLAGEAYKGDPRYEIIVDGEVVAKGVVDWAQDTTSEGRYDLSGDGNESVDWRDVSVDLQMPEGGFQSVEVRFPNDAYRRGVGDRNLIVDQIAIDGHVIEAESADVEYQGGKFAEGQTSERMPWAGKLKFDVSEIFDDAAAQAAPEGAYVLENDAGAVVGTLSASDPDAGDTHSFTVSDDRFEVVDGQLKLREGVSLDFEQVDTVSVEVTATDAGGLSTSETIDVSVVDLFEQPVEAPQVEVSPAFSARYFDVDHKIRTLDDIDFSVAPTHIEATDDIDYENSRGSFWEGGSKDTFAANITGQINVPEDGVFTFTLGADDGAVLLIDGEPLIDNDGLHAFKTSAGAIELDAGPHTIEVMYFENKGHAGLKLEWEGPGLDGTQLVTPAAPEVLAGIEGEPLDFSVDIAFQGTESTLTIEGLPAGTQIDAGEHSLYVDDGTADLTGMDLSQMSITPPDGFEGEVDAELIATNAEGGETRVPIEFEVVPAPWESDTSESNSHDADAELMNGMDQSGESTNDVGASGDEMLLEAQIETAEAESTPQEQDHQAGAEF